MSLFNKKTAFMVAKIKDGSVFPSNWLELAQKNTLPKFDLIREKTEGFRSPKTLYIELTEENCSAAKDPYLTYTIAERKVSKALLEVAMKREEEKIKKETGVSFLSRNDKKELKERIIERLKPSATLSLMDITFLVNAKTGFIFIASTSNNAIDTLIGVFSKVFNTELEYYDIESLAAPDQLKDFTIRTDYVAELTPLSARNFLTWLWKESETKDAFPVYFNNSIELEDNSQEEDIKGAKNSVVKKANCCSSSEAKSALLSGKKLKKAHITIESNDTDLYSGTVNIDNLSFSGLKFPEGEEMGNDFEQERIDYMISFVNIIEHLFSLYKVAAKDIVLLENEMRIWATNKDSK